MKKGYYIHFNARDTVGVSKKIDMQLTSFRKYYTMSEIDIKMSTKSKIKNALAVFPFFCIKWDYSKAYQDIIDPDFIYIRRASGDRKHYIFLKYIKEKYPNCKIIVEIPTYPFWRESLQSIMGVMLIKDYYNYWTRLNKYIDRIVTYSSDEKIFGIETICVKNGINVCEVNSIKECVEYDESKLNILAVAVLKPHHGYERLFQGLSFYYKNGGTRDILVRIVGEGPEKEYYEKLADELQLQEHVCFMGAQYGESLQRIYDVSDIAVSALGFYKDGVTKSSALKVREYLAEGLPVISGAREDAFDDTDGKYCVQFPNDSSMIDIEKVVCFYDQLRIGKTRMQLAQDIRNMAYKTIDNEITLEPIRKYIEEV